MHLDQVTEAADDPILGVATLYNKDSRPNKVNLGIGVYFNEQGKVDLFETVAQADIELANARLNKNYLPMSGSPLFNQLSKKFILGEEHPASQRADLLQTLAGTGALKIGALFLNEVVGAKTVWVSDITWSNHYTIFESAGFKCKNYAYYDAVKNGFNLEGCLADLEQAQSGDVILLQACCHNPTGVDPDFEQWKKILQVVKQKQLIPFFDAAYVGLANSVEQDLKAIRLFAAEVDDLLLSLSFSKIFGLYAERIGSLLIVAKNANIAKAAQSQCSAIVRANYSTPAIHGARIVENILDNSQRKNQWYDELVAMNTRIKKLRNQLVNGLKAHGLDFEFINNQYGMFSFSGISKQQVQKLRDDYAIYMLSNGRINIAGLTQNNIQYVIDSIASVVK